MNLRRDKEQAGDTEGDENQLNEDRLRAEREIETEERNEQDP